MKVATEAGSGKPSMVLPSRRESVLLASIAFLVAQKFNATFYDPQDYLDGIGATPFQYRELVPAIAKAIQLILPLQAESLFWIIQAGFTLWMFHLAFRLIDRFGLDRRWFWLFAIEIIVDYAGPFVNYVYFYDIPAVIVSMLGILALQERRLGFFYLVLVLGILNRETAVLLILLFVVETLQSMPRGRLLRYLTLQLLLFVALKLLLYVVFRHNVGHGVASWIADEPDRPEHYARYWYNLEFLASWKCLFLFGGAWLPILVTLKDIRDPFISRALWLIPAEFLVMFFVGNYQEPRIFDELVPIILLGAAAGVQGRIDRRRHVDAQAATG